MDGGLLHVRLEHRFSRKEAKCTWFEQFPSHSPFGSHWSLRPEHSSNRNRPLSSPALTSNRCPVCKCLRASISTAREGCNTAKCPPRKWTCMSSRTHSFRRSPITVHRERVQSQIPRRLRC